MPRDLVRYHQTGHFHFINFSCHHRKPYLASPASRDLFERLLEIMLVRYDFVVAGYVLMSEHVHLLLSEPKRAPLSRAIQALNLSVSVQSKERPFWQAQYYDFKVFTPDKRVEKLRYMHRNPVVRELMGEPVEWEWSSFRHYATGEQRAVELESDWTAAKGNRAST